MSVRAGLDARHRGAVIRESDPPLRRDIGAIYRPGPLTAGAEAFLASTREGCRFLGGGRHSLLEE